MLSVSTISLSSVRSISRDEAITPGGTSELRYLAAVINQYVALQSQRQKELRTIAELDALTQIPNRREARYAGGSVLTYVTLKNGTEAVATSEGRLSDALKPGSTAYLYWNPAQAAVIGGTSHGA